MLFRIIQFLMIVLPILLWGPDLHGAAGDLDINFDADGKVISDFSGTQDTATDAVIQPDGKIIVAGIANSTNNLAMIRYNPDGSLDNTFGTNGKAVHDLPNTSEGIHAVALQPDGKIIAAGRAGGNFVLARFLSNGTLDTTFGGGAGFVTTDFTGDTDTALDVAIQPDGKIVLAGMSENLNANDFALARYLPDGNLDTTFSFDGKVATDLGSPNDILKGIILLGDGKIIAAGFSGEGPGVDFVIARYNADGNLDSSFGSGGIVTTDFGGKADFAHAIALQGGNKIIAAGYAIIDNDFRFALARYNSNGTLDTTFNGDGKAIANSGSISISNSVIVQPDGKIIAAGLGGDALSQDFMLARFTPDGDLDPTFNQDGIATTDFGTSIDQANIVLLQSDGKIVAAGIAIGDFATARYENDPVPPSLFSDDYEDGILASDWTYVKPNWSETGGNLIGTPAARKAETIASPAFNGCSLCTMQTSMQTSGGAGNKVWFLPWFVDKRTTIEVLMKEENDKWVLRQRFNGSVVAKTKGIATILPNTFYNVQVTFDGSNITLVVDGVTLATLPAFAPPAGTVGFRVKNTTGRFGFVNVN